MLMDGDFNGDDDDENDCCDVAAVAVCSTEEDCKAALMDCNCRFSSLICLYVLIF